MRIYVPHAGGAHPECVAALEAQAPGRVEYVDVGGDPTAYWGLLVNVWEQGEAFMLVESDIVIAPGTIQALEACPKPWCSCGSANFVNGAPRDTREIDRLIGDRPRRCRIAALQCNRFRLDDMNRAQRRKLVRGVPPHSQHWGNLSAWLLPRLEKINGVCVHHEFSTRHVATRTREEHDRRYAERSEWYRAHSPPQLIRGGGSVIYPPAPDASPEEIQLFLRTHYG